MDPDANIKEQLKIANELLDVDFFSEDELTFRAVRLSELVIELNEWIERGGFLPDNWRNK